MREPKPEWSSVPPEVQLALAHKLGSPVSEASIAWGGYTPSASFIAQLEDGRRVFIKGAHPGQSSFGVAAFKAEQSIYLEYPQLSGIAPTYICDVQQGDWNLMVLEAIEGGEHLVPWTEAKLVAVFKTIHELSRRIPQPTPDMPRLEKTPELTDLMNGRAGWSVLLKADMLKQFYNKFTDPIAAKAWFEPILPRLALLECEVNQVGGRHQVLHVDLRSDNLLLRADGTAVLLDWPNLCWGPLVYDLCFFINSVVLEGYATHEELFALAGQVMDTEFEQQDLLRCLANMSGYFAASCVRPEVPALPRLRTFQRQQLMACLPLLQRVFDLPLLGLSKFS